MRAVEGVDGVASATPTGEVSERRLDRHGRRHPRAATRSRRPRSASCRRSATRSPTSARALTALRRRRLGDPVRLRPGDRERPEADRAARPAGDRDDPRDPAAGAGRAAGPDRERDPLVPLHARDLGPVHPLRRRRRRLRRLDPDLRLHLPGRARDRLHDLPDGAGARGGARPRHPRGHAARDRGHRPGDHQSPG